MIDNDVHGQITGSYHATDKILDNLVDGSAMAKCDNNVFNQIALISHNNFSP